MSVNITVNGEYMRSCPKHYLLGDQERLKKEAENERRKLRIQQVRAASKDMARKVRNNVEMEKERQMKKIEEIKAKEMEMWRQNILEEKEANYKSAIFQIGTAHRAAKRENEKQAKVKINTKPRTPKLIRNRGPSIHKGKENKLKTANVQTEITGGYCPEPSQVRKCTSFAIDSFISDSDDDTAMHQNISSSSLGDSNLLTSSDTMSSSLIELRELPTTLKERPCKADQRILQSITTIKSPHKKFDAVSKKLSKPDSVAKMQDVKAASLSKSAKKEEKITQSHEKDQNDEMASRPMDTRKRFTQITDFIRQQEASGGAVPQSFPTKSPNKTKSPASKRSHQTQVSKSSTSPLKSKSSTTFRPLSEQRVDASANKLSAGTSGRVQFYDHNNRFQKEYNQPASIIQIHSTSNGDTEMNAMEQAELDRRLREVREDEIDKLRKKTDDRCQKAIEREQVRRACEDLTAKLDALSKQRPLLPSDNHQYSSVRLGQLATDREAKLNSAVENILRRPAVITCPPINRQQKTATPAASAPVINELNVGSAVNDMSTLNSSDSCCSILLGYVNGQTKQITDDIKKYNNHSGETGKVKVEKLQDLLNRINRLRETLLSEIAKYTSSNSSDKDMVKKLIDSISQFRKERDSILIENNAEDITKRENALKKKEAILEQKLREFYKTQKAVKKNATRGEECSDKENRVEKQEKTSSMPSMSKERVEEAVLRNADVEQKEDDISHLTKKNTSGKCSKKHFEGQKKETQKEVAKESEEVQPSKESKENRGEEKTNVIHSEEESDESSDEYVKHKELIIDKKPLEIVIKVRGSKKAKKTVRLPSKSPRKLSTLIQSPISTKNRKKVSTARSNDSSSTSYRSLPSAIHTGMDNLIINEPQPKDKVTTVDSKRKETHDTSLKKKRSNLNPLMAHYVQRLLGMSRSSINALGMLSSDIETPSSSIVNTTANLSSTETEMLASSRLENVQKFIEENYSFINELEESLRQSNAKESSLRTAEVAWKKTLKEQKKAPSSGKDPENISNSAEAKRKRNGYDSEKKSSNPITSQDTQKRSVEIETIKQQAIQVDKSTQLTDNCTQRIAELSAMIDKIRQEKQKILETTFSSVSETGPNSTEYLDLPDRRNERSSSKSLEGQLSKSTENLPTQSLGGAPQLKKNNIIGMSRDSGISLSRPITVQETREGSMDNLQKEQSSTESLSLHNKPPKPPISITRYSPQLVEDIPHELSTIFEVETPATSKMNTSINGQRTDASAQLQNDQSKKIVYNKFPTFEEYARLNQLDMSQFDPEFSMQFEKEFNEFMQLAKDGKIADYERFTSFSQYMTKSSSRGDKEVAEEMLESLKMTNLSFKKFPTRKEYLSKIGVSTSDMIDSQSLEYIDESKNCYSTNSSSESLMNIENELKQRKILTKSFRQNASPLAHSSTTSGEPREMNPGMKSYHNEMSGIMQFAVTSTDDQSENLEQELQRLGINWHSAMKKKTMQTQALSSTSSSLEQVSPRSKKHRHKTVDTSNMKQSRDRTIHTEEGGRQLNIREFLTRELLKRTTTSSSISFSDDSVASSILRSIIGSITSSPAAVEAAPTLERHKTSTPMASHSTSVSGRGATKSRGSGSSQLFSGESLLSSVHFNNHSGDVHKGPQISATSEPPNKPL